MSTSGDELKEVLDSFCIKTIEGINNKMRELKEGLGEKVDSCRIRKNL